MDTRFNTLGEWSSYFSHCAKKQGAAYADDQIERLFGEKIKQSDFLNGMKEAFSSSSESELRRLLHITQALGDAGYYLHMDALFQMGLPRKEFIVKCNLTHGRLGDSLLQMAHYIHAMRELNLVLIVRTYGDPSKTVFLNLSSEFESDLFMIDMNKPVSNYLRNVAFSSPFDRRLLFSFSSQLLGGFQEMGQLSGLKNKLLDTVVLHVRSGDGLFCGGNMSLPPMHYYLDSIKNSGCKKALVVAEPFYEGKDPFPSPVPGLIESACQEMGVECKIQSSELFGIDVATLFYAKHVVASNSSLSKLIPLYGDSCTSLTIPDSPGGGKHWFQDACIAYIDCWHGFNREKWQESLDYRIAWVSGEA